MQKHILYSIARLSLTFLLLMSFDYANGQVTVSKKKLPRAINVPTKSHIYPSLTADGTFMVFYSNYSQTGKFELKSAKKIGSEVWEDPELIEHIVKPTNDHFGSYSVSYDGNYLYFSSYRANGIGKYDIWYAQRVGNGWSAPQNPGKPLNSGTNEGNPCVSPDGRTIYFMRCGDMKTDTKDNCSIYYAEKVSRNRWGEPVALPSYVNTGHSTTPIILPDNETLIFSSERSGNKGKVDLYMTRKENGIWTHPVAMDFMNTPRSDEFVSVPAQGDIIYYTDVHNELFIIAKAILPEDFRPKKVMLITGKIEGYNEDSDIIIQAYNAETREFYSTADIYEKDGSFMMTLPEGRIYDFSIFPTNGQYKYRSELFDLKGIETSKWERMEFDPEPLYAGDEMILHTIQFEDDSHLLSPISNTEFRRIVGIMQKNRDISLEFNVYIDQEEVIDSSQMNYTYYDETIDSATETYVEEEFVNIEDETDTVTYESLSYEESEYQNFEEDIIEPAEPPVDKIQQLSEERAVSILNYLVEKGVPAHRITANGMGKDFVENHATDDKNYWVEMIIK